MSLGIFPGASLPSALLGERASMEMLNNANRLIVDDNAAAT